MSPIDEAVKRILAAVSAKPAPIDKSKPKTVMVKGNMRDERTFAQLAEQRFSGIRANDLWLRFELWILGRLERTISYSEFFNEPEALNKMYSEYFDLDIKLSDNVANDIKRLKERKVLLGDTDIQRALQAREDAEKRK